MPFPLSPSPPTAASLTYRSPAGPSSPTCHLLWGVFLDASQSHVKIHGLVPIPWCLLSFRLPVPSPACTWAENPASLPSPVAFACSPRLCPLSFGEGVEFDPLPPTEVRYTSSVKYDSERHFIDDVHLPLGLAVASCSQTVTCIPNCTWRNYKAEVRFEPRHKATRFLSTTIVYPKYPKTVYTTTLDYNCRKTLRRFLSSVELEASELLGSDGLSDEC
ncbi:refilin-B isoform X2 [Mirounga leonina]|uniref:refilin-B isoform X2 n=1 Tax=Mirounga leonina TaxID=9715 RepID=UPI00156C4381|nr:refilin-B isoform X2 [Mirounga leonina]